MLSNQIKVLLQRVRMAGREPLRLLMPNGLRWALKAEGSPEYHHMHNGDFFGPLPIVVDDTLKEILVQVEPLPDQPTEAVDWKNVIKVERM